MTTERMMGIRRGRVWLLGGVAVAISLVGASGAAAGTETPQLTKTFTPNQVQLGETTTLEFTITNPSGSGQSWSFTDELAPALSVAQSTPTGDTCTGTAVDAPLDSGTIGVSGQVPGSGSCAVSMLLQVTETGTHANDEGNVTETTNIEPPTSPAQVQCDDPDAPPVDDIDGVFIDCDFSEEPPPSDFTIKQDWETDAETPAYQTPVVGDLFGTDAPAIVVGANRDAIGGAPLTGRLANDLKVYDGATGNLLHTITTPRYMWSSFAVAAIADVNGDGRGEIIFRASSRGQTQADADSIGVPSPADADGRLVAYEYDPGADDWNVLWVSDERYDQGPGTTGNQARTGGAISLADFNGDGTPEVYVGNEVFNASTGVRLATGAANEPSGCQGGSSAVCLLAQTVAVDTDGDGDLELAAGNAVYDVQITNVDGEAGNSMSIAETADPSNANAKDGQTAVADMDLDGAPEIIVTIAASPTVLYVWDPRTGDIEGMRTGTQMVGGNGTAGSPPMIGDIDGDGRPEIVMVTVNRVRAFDFVPGTGLDEIWTLVTNDLSGGTSMSMFDFNSDGQQEIVYRDERNIRIMDGGPTPPNTTNRNLASFSCGSGTAVEMPVIADITGTGEARIVITCGVTDGSTGGALRAYETASFPWANTRPVWNQQAYFVTHINDDLTVPSEQFPNWAVFEDPAHLCSDGINRPLNGFQVQVTDLDADTGCPVLCEPPFVVEKTSDPPTGAVVEPGDTIAYTVTIESTLDVDIPDVELTDDLSGVLDDAALTSGPAVSPGGAGTAQLNGDQLEFVGTIPAGATVAITYEVTVNQPAQLGDRSIGNAVIGEFSNCDGDDGDPSCTTEHPVGVPETDLELEKTGDAVVDPGDPVTYTLTVTNNGPDPSTGSTVTDTPPGDLTNIATATPGCAVQSQTVTCDIGSLEVDESTEIEITADAPNASATCFENEAAVEAGDDDPEPGNDEASFRTCTTPAADLRVSKSVSPAVVDPGGQLSYTIAVVNDGPGDATNVVVTDELPDGLTNVQAPGNCQVADQTLTCEIATLPSGEGLALPIFATAPTTPSSCFENVASVEGDEGDPDLSDNETDPVRACTTPAADLQISKSGPATVDAGGEVSYVLEILNNGPDQASGVVVTDTLPDELTNIQAPQGCDVQGQTVTCEIGTFNPNNLTNILITADAPDTGSTCFENVASIEGDEGDPDLSNNESDQVETCVVASDLAISKVSNPTVVDPGGEFGYLIRVTNEGPDDATGVVVTDTLPSGLTNLQLPAACQQQGNTVTCNVGPVAANGQSLISIRANAPDTPATCLENVASVDGEQSDPDPANNETTARTCTTPAADLELEKAAPAEVDAGGQVTWTITVTNTGPQASSGSTVTDELPSEVSDVQVPQGCDVQNGTVTCDVGPLDPDQSTDIEITGTAPSDPGTCFSNDASVEGGGSEGDPDLSNNEDSVETCTNEEADLEITKSVDQQGAVRVGQLLTYTLTITNHGANDAADVAVGDGFGADVNVESVTPSQGTCTDAPPISCQLGDLSNGATATIEIKARPLDKGQLANAATVDSTTEDPDPQNNEDEVTTRVKRAKISVKKKAKPSKVKVGDIVRYRIVVRSRTAVRLTGLKVCDNVPKALKLVSARGAKVRGNTACWRFDLPPRGKRTFRVRAKVKPTKDPLRVKNTAKATGPDVKPARGRDSVGVKPQEGTGGPGPCGAIAKRC